MTNDQRQMTDKRVALVLGSGGARGLAHIGAIEALEERGYTITSVAGCSMGSIIAGMSEQILPGRTAVLKLCLQRCQTHHSNGS